MNVRRAVSVPRVRSGYASVAAPALGVAVTVAPRAAASAFPAWVMQAATATGKSPQEVMELLGPEPGQPAIPEWALAAAEATGKTPEEVIRDLGMGLSSKPGSKTLSDGPARGITPMRKRMPMGVLATPSVCIAAAPSAGPSTGVRIAKPAARTQGVRESVVLAAAPARAPPTGVAAAMPSAQARCQTPNRILVRQTSPQRSGMPNVRVAQMPMSQSVVVESPRKVAANVAFNESPTRKSFPATVNRPLQRVGSANVPVNMQQQELSPRVVSTAHHVALSSPMRMTSSDGLARASSMSPRQWLPTAGVDGLVRDQSTSPQPRVPTVVRSVSSSVVPSPRKGLVDEVLSSRDVAISPRQWPQSSAAGGSALLPRPGAQEAAVVQTMIRNGSTFAAAQQVREDFRASFSTLPMDSAVDECLQKHAGDAPAGEAVRGSIVPPNAQAARGSILVHGAEATSEDVDAWRRLQEAHAPVVRQSSATDLDNLLGRQSSVTDLDNLRTLIRTASMELSPRGSKVESMGTEKARSFGDIAKNLDQDVPGEPLPPKVERYISASEALLRLPPFCLTLEDTGPPVPGA